MSVPSFKNPTSKTTILVLIPKLSYSLAMKKKHVALFAHIEEVSDSTSKAPFKTVSYKKTTISSFSSSKPISSVLSKYT